MANDATIRLRRARCLVVTFTGGGALAVQFVTQQTAALDEIGLALLAGLEEWTEPASLLDRLAGRLPRDLCAAALIRLIDGGAVVVEGTDLARDDARVHRVWEWGPFAGAFHFGIKNARYAGPAEVLAGLAARVATTPRVELHTSNEGLAEVIALQPPDLDEGLLAVMRRRRSYRGFARDAPLPLAALRDCLFAGLGIVGFIETPTPGEGPLPLRMTPSGGARNPFEAYVAARNVEGLAPGVYHYAAAEGTLGLVHAGPLPALSAMVGEQAWAAHAGALVLLAAKLQRSMWKYTHPGGLRVALIEAGHVAQNMLLAATSHGLAAAPTCAVSDAVVEPLCGLDPATEAVVHTVALGVRSDTPSEADIGEIAPNPFNRRA